MHVGKVIDILWNGIQSLRGPDAESIMAVWPKGGTTNPAIHLKIQGDDGKVVEWEISKDGIYKVQPPGIGRSRKN